MPKYSIEKFSRVVEAIYDCALDPEKWRATLPLIAEFLGLSYAGLHFLDSKTMTGVRGYEHGLNAQQTDALVNRYAPMFSMQSLNHMGAVGEPARIVDLISYDEYLRGQFYREWGKDADAGDYIGMVALRSGTRMAMASHSRSHAQPRFTQEDLEAVRLLAPHYCRAVTISDALSLKTVQSEMLERTLDGLAAGVYLVAEDARVLYVNPAAERQIASGRVLALVGQRLAAVNAASAAQLTAALREAANDKATSNAGGHSIGLSAAHGQGLIATVLPLQRGQRQSFQPFAAAVAVFVQNPANIPPLPGEAFARLYNLTPSELRVALALSPGLLPQEAADMLGISLATVKTHLSKVFEKTKTARQADLVALMMRAGSPVG